MPIPSSEAPLTPAERVVLRGAAHALKPTVMIGNGGVTPAVIAETQRALDAHQLIKIKMLSDDREARSAAHSLLCEQLVCHPVQIIGKIFVLFKDDGSYIPPTLMDAPKSRIKKGPHVPKKQLANA
jgi:putative YhbY family RNA-binding protein